MIRPLGALDAMFLHVEGPSTPMHVGAVMVLEPGDGPFDVPRFAAGLEARLDRAPRLRRRLRRVPGGVTAPVWVDDDRFDLAHHVRHVALPAPGTGALLDELVADVLADRLDRRRPLWELHVVEGLAGGRVALVAKVHHAVGDGLALLATTAALLGAGPDVAPVEDAADEAPPRSAPAPDALAVGLAAARWYARAARGTAARVTGSVAAARPDVLVRSAGGLAAAGLGLLAGSPVPALHAATGPRRRFTAVTGSLAEHRAVRRRHGGTVNDVVLAVVAGALRRWLADRGERADTVRALVPCSLRARGGAAQALDGRAGAAETGNAISAHLVDLPVGVADPVRRLARVRAATEAAKRRGPASAPLLGAVADLAPSAVQRAGARLAAQCSGRVFDVLVTHVPGPPRPLHCAGARVRDLVPAVPLAPGQVLGIGVVSYAGGLHYGLTADRATVPDLDALAAHLRASIAELVDRSVPDLASLRPAPRRPASGPAPDPGGDRSPRGRARGGAGGSGGALTGAGLPVGAGWRRAPALVHTHAADAPAGPPAGGAADERRHLRASGRTG